MTAAETGDIEALKLAIASGAPVDGADQRKSPLGQPTLLTPCMWACRQGQSTAVAYLIAHRASVAARDFSCEPR